MKHQGVKLIGGSLKGLVIPAGEPQEPETNRIVATSAGIRHRSPQGWVNAPANMLFDFISHTFTSAGKEGPYGPSTQEVQSAYVDASWAQSNDFLSVSGGVQVWTVPATGLYEIDVAGAGGSVDGYSSFGRGAIMRGQFYLTAHQKLRILVGQRPVNQSNSGDSQGGAGGSFVWEDGITMDDEPMVVGGGGSSLVNGSSYRNASTYLDGRNADNSPIGMSPDSPIKYSQSGAGWRQNASALAGSTEAKTPINGGQGGDDDLYGDGGFGGGGCQSNNAGNCGGGGGGYTGGIGAYMHNSNQRPGGGGSYVNPAASLRQSLGHNTSRYGYVKITRL